MFDIIWTLNIGWDFPEETVVWSLQRWVSLPVTGAPPLTWRMQQQPMAPSILAGAICWAPCVALRPLLHSSMTKGLKLSPGHIQPMGPWLVLKDPDHLSHNMVPCLALHILWHRCWDWRPRWMISSRCGRAGWRCYQVFIATPQKDRNPFLSHGWCKGYVSTPHPLQGKVALLSLSYWWRKLGLIFLNLHWHPLETRECLNSSLCWVCPGSNSFQKGGSNHSWKVQLFPTWLHVCTREVLFSRFKNACKHPFKIEPTNSIKKRFLFSSHSKFTVPTFSFKFWMLGLLITLSCSSTLLALKASWPNIVSAWFLVYSECLTIGVVPLVFCSASNDTSKCFLMLLMASVATEIGFSTDCILVAFN